jgi:hypothetical protein
MGQVKVIKVDPGDNRAVIQLAEETQGQIREDVRAHIRITEEVRLIKADLIDQVKGKVDQVVQDPVDIIPVDLIVIKEIIRDRKAAKEAKEAAIIIEALKPLTRMRMISLHMATDPNLEGEGLDPKDLMKEKILTKRFSTRRWLRRTITEEIVTE